MTKKRGKNVTHGVVVNIPPHSTCIMHVDICISCSTYKYREKEYSGVKKIFKSSLVPREI